MSESKHTPGPWHACCLDGPAHYVFGPNGDGTICEPFHNDPKEEKYEPACGTITIEERRANARLIAAAPDLLAALERHLPILERAEECPTIWEELTKGTGIATLNGYRHALSAARDGKEAP